jgi:pre-mRNA-splicing factor ATP-dependent RNA helicase DHX15/PRP43
MDIILSEINDILDSKAVKNNYINNKSYSDNYKESTKLWNYLPMYSNIDYVKKFFNTYHECNAILIISATGSGKTVIVPKFVLKYNITSNINGIIAVTNPKTLTTLNNAQFSSKIADVELGKEIGYKYKGSPPNSMSENTKLLYCTDGILLAEILSGDHLLKRYSCVIIDEAHERNVQIDILLFFLKNILYHRSDFKLIIMSATINSSVFKNYFNRSVKEEWSKIKFSSDSSYSPTEIKNKITYGELEVAGSTNFEITHYWSDNKKINNYIK